MQYYFKRYGIKQAWLKWTLDGAAWPVLFWKTGVESLNNSWVASIWSWKANFAWSTCLQNAAEKIQCAFWNGCYFEPDSLDMDEKDEKWVVVVGSWCCCWWWCCWYCLGSSERIVTHFNTTCLRTAFTLQSAWVPAMLAKLCDFDVLTLFFKWSDKNLTMNCGSVASGDCFALGLGSVGGRMSSCGFGLALSLSTFEKTMCSCMCWDWLKHFAWCPSFSSL